MGPREREALKDAEAQLMRWQSDTMSYRRALASGEATGERLQSYKGALATAETRAAKYELIIEFLEAGETVDKTNRLVEQSLERRQKQKKVLEDKLVPELCLGCRQTTGNFVKRDHEYEGICDKCQKADPDPQVLIEHIDEYNEGLGTYGEAELPCPACEQFVPTCTCPRCNTCHVHVEYCVCPNGDGTRRARRRGHEIRQHRARQETRRRAEEGRGRPRRRERRTPGRLRGVGNPFTENVVQTGIVEATNLAATAFTTGTGTLATRYTAGDIGRTIEQEAQRELQRLDQRERAAAATERQEYITAFNRALTEATVIDPETTEEEIHLIDDLEGG